MSLHKMDCTLTCAGLCPRSRYTIASRHRSMRGRLFFGVLLHAIITCIIHRKTISL